MVSYSHRSLTELSAMLHVLPNVAHMVHLVKKALVLHIVVPHPSGAVWRAAMTLADEQLRAVVTSSGASDV